MMTAVKIFLLGFILFGEAFCRTPGLQSDLRHGRSRTTRHKEKKNVNKRQRLTACPPSDYQDDKIALGNLSLSDMDQKRDLGSYMRPTGNDSLAEPGNSTFASDTAGFKNSSLANSSEDAVQMNSSAVQLSNEVLLDHDNSSQSVINGSQYNESLVEGTPSVSNTSTSNSNLTGALNSTNMSNSSNSILDHFSPDGMQKNNLFLGFLPDDGSSGGTRQTMAQINSDIGQKSAVYGWYAQAHSGVPFDGSQLLAIIDDVKACNCVFQPAIMPIGGWQGLTAWDNSQAVKIAEVLKNFTDEDIPVWLRFAHEVNYYQTDGTYQGTASDFKAGWATVAKAISDIAPNVKMWWSPNVSTPEDYAAYEPDDMGTVDLVGVDFYPKQLNGNDFLQTMQGFHDKYATDGRKFAIGETGLGWNGGLDDKAKWFDEICQAKASLPEFVSMAWFNFDKEYDYKIAGEPTLNQKFTVLIAS